MVSGSYLFTSESVSCGHPDKLCDQISDAILDKYLSQDKSARVAIETLFKGKNLVIAGEVTSFVELTHDDFSAISQEVLTDCNYNEETFGCPLNEISLHLFLSKQSPDISRGVDKYNGLGAGDQGLMFGFACKETNSLMPFAIHWCHRLMEKHKQVVKNNKALGPDAKCQITAVYENSHPTAIETIVFSSQHAENVSVETLREIIIEEIIKTTIPANYLKKTRYLINPTGKFVLGGPLADAGLTGRKIIVDTYGGYARHGGGAFSGKDPTKVDRSGAYMARHIAKSLVANDMCSFAEVQISYSIGISEPVAIYINSDSPDNEDLVAFVKDKFPLSVSGIINYLELSNQRYLETAAFGHFGRVSSSSFSWEKIELFK